MDVSIVVATFGDVSWQRLAAERAVPSAMGQPAEVVVVHDFTLHEARNHGAAEASGEWLCFLDADDELEDGYIDALAAGTCDLRAPAVRYVRPGRNVPNPRVMRVAGHNHDCEAGCLAYGNFLVIGTLVRAVMFHDVGGFRDYPCYEDFDLWVRCWQAGATVETFPAAVYRAHVRPDSRNRGTLTPEQKHAVHQRIAADNQIPVPA